MPRPASSRRAGRRPFHAPPRPAALHQSGAPTLPTTSTLFPVHGDSAPPTASALPRPRRCLPSLGRQQIRCFLLHFPSLDAGFGGSSRLGATGVRKKRILSGHRLEQLRTAGGALESDDRNTTALVSPVNVSGKATRRPCVVSSASGIDFGAKLQAFRELILVPSFKPPKNAPRGNKVVKEVIFGLGDKKYRYCKN